MRTRRGDRRVARPVEPRRKPAPGSTRPVRRRGRRSGHPIPGRGRGSGSPRDRERSRPRPPTSRTRFVRRCASCVPPNADPPAGRTRSARSPTLTARRRGVPEAPIASPPCADLLSSWSSRPSRPARSRSEPPPGPRRESFESSPSPRSPKYVTGGDVLVRVLNATGTPKFSVAGHDVTATPSGKTRVVGLRPPCRGEPDHGDGRRADGNARRREPLDQRAGVLGAAPAVALHHPGGRPRGDDRCEVRWPDDRRVPVQDREWRLSLRSPAGTDHAPGRWRRLRNVNGQSVPYVVRLERGVINRTPYSFAVLNVPSAWNQRLVYQFGGGCGTTYSQGSPLGTDVVNDSLLAEGLRGRDRELQHVPDVVQRRALRRDRDDGEGARRRDDRHAALHDRRGCIGWRDPAADDRPELPGHPRRALAGHPVPRRDLDRARASPTAACSPTSTPAPGRASRRSNAPR